MKSNDRGESQKRGTAHRVIQALFSGVLGQACGGSALANGLNGFGLSQTKGDDMNVARINIRLGGATGKTLAALAIVGSLLAGCATLPDDSKEAKVMRFNNLNNYRFCEVWLIGGDALTKDLSGAFYNTTDLNNKANPRDSCPADMWAKVDAEALKNQYNLLGVFKNGPRYWMYDWIVDHVLHLAHVPGPVIRGQDLHRPARDAVHPLAQRRPFLLDQVRHQQGDVLAALAERWHVNRKYAEPVVQVLAESAPLHLALQVAV